jgi:hypothetical protein
MPPMLAISMVSSSGFLFRDEVGLFFRRVVFQSAYELLRVVGGFCAKRGGGLWPCAAEDRGTILQDALRDFVAGFEDDELLAGDESKDGVGCGLGVFDEVAIDGERTAVQAFQFDHVKSSSQVSHRQRWLRSIEEELMRERKQIKKGLG